MLGLLVLERLSNKIPPWVVKCLIIHRHNIKAETAAILDLQVDNSKGVMPKLRYGTSFPILSLWFFLYQQEKLYNIIFII